MSTSTSNPLTKSVEMRAQDIAAKAATYMPKALNSPMGSSPPQTKAPPISKASERAKKPWARTSFMMKKLREKERKNDDIPRREANADNTAGHSTECISYSNCGKYLASGGEDKAIHIYTSLSLNLMAHPFKCDSSVESLDFSQDGKLLCSGHKSGKITLWHLHYEGEEKHHGHSGQVKWTKKEDLEQHNGGVKAVKFSPDGKRFASGGSDTELIVWDMTSSENNRTFFHVKAKINAAVKAAEMKEKALSSLQSMSSFDLPSVFNTPKGKAEKRQTFMSASTRTAFGSSKHSERMSSQVEHFEKHKESITSISWDQNEDNQLLATGSKDNTVRVWDLQDEDNIETMILEGHTHDVRSVAFSPDGQSLASVGGGSMNDAGAEIRIWDMRGQMLGDEEQAAVIEGHEMGVTSVVWSDNGKMICTGSYDKTIRFWTVDNGKCYRVINSDAEVRALAAGKAQRYIAIGDNTGSVKRYHFTFPIEGYELKLHRAFKAGGLEMEKLLKRMIEDDNHPLENGGIYLIVEYLLHNTKGDDLKLLFDTIWTLLQEFDEEKTNDDPAEAKKAIEHFDKLDECLKSFFAHVQKFKPQLLKYLARNLEADGELQKVAETEIMRVAMDLYSRGGVLQIYYTEILIYCLYMMCFATSTVSLKFKHDMDMSTGATIEDRMALEVNEYILIVTSLYFMIREFFQIYKEFFQHGGLKDYILWVEHNIMLNVFMMASNATAIYFLVLTFTSDDPQEAWFKTFLFCSVGTLVMFALNTLGWWEFIDIVSPSGSLGIIVFFVRYGPGEYFDHLASAVAVVNWIKFLNVIRGLNKDIATFILMIEFILEDIFSFIFVQLIVMVMFGHALYLELAEKHMEFHDTISGSNPYLTIWATAQTLLKTLFGDFDSTVYTYDYVRLLFFAYMFMVIIIMLNVLIAIVGDSYGRAMAQSTQLFFKSRLLLIVEMKVTFKVFLKHFPTPETIQARLGRLTPGFIRGKVKRNAGIVIFNLEKGVDENDVWDDRMQEISDKVTEGLVGTFDKGQSDLTKCIEEVNTVRTNMMKAVEDQNEINTQMLENNEKLLESNAELQRVILLMNKKMELMDLHVLGKMKSLPLSKSQKSFGERVEKGLGGGKEKYQDL
ncbi:hypothetical protein TL16_g06482 [Triparma laevis f. inornata]|uniref:Polycystin cation channel PKD1/PKD2 domain-containing protein n=1 Tax=Triparma laevis f. inornata TaxID=1714386 RepID=A0A9W7AS32_9STRA|nr:hypothetical protein TL16_g06482 [Triparma laevis f. inornata]